MTLKNDEKSEEELNFKHGIQNLTNFETKIYTLMGWFWPEYIMFELRKNRGAIFHDTRV